MSTLKRTPFLQALYKSSIPYPAPSNLNYFWNFGILAMVFLAVQIITGLFLAMHYIPSIELAFLSVEHIMRDVHYGWLFRYLHANGASFFFIVVYAHMFRGIYYASYSIYSSRYLLWAVGVIIFFLMIVIAFLGYVLPWGQMSFWGATVITNLVGAIPVIGSKILILLWGSFFISQPTLDRFFILHFFLPAVLTVLVLVHLALLHEYHSSNPLTFNFSIDGVNFFPFYIWKDLLGILFFLALYSTFVFFFPNYLSHSINYVEAEPLVTPPHIVPEWYFLPFYAILRSIPDKLAGVIFLLLSIFIMLLFPSAEDEVVRSPYFDRTYRFFFWNFICDWLILTYLGGCPAEEPYISIGWFTTFNYFMGWCFLTALTQPLIQTYVFLRWVFVSPIQEMKWALEDKAQELAEKESVKQNVTHICGVVIYGFKYRAYPEKKMRKIIYDKSKVPEPVGPKVYEWKKPTLEEISQMHEMRRPNTMKQIEYYNFSKKPITEITHFPKETIREEIHAKTKAGKIIENFGESVISTKDRFSKFMIDYYLTEKGEDVRVLKLQSEYVNWDIRMQTDWSFWLAQGDKFLMSTSQTMTAYMRHPPDDGYARFLRRDQWLYGLYNSNPNSSRLYNNWNKRLDNWPLGHNSAGIWYDVTDEIKRFKCKREYWQACDWRKPVFDPVTRPTYDWANWTYIYRTATTEKVPRREIVLEVKHSEVQKYVMENAIHKISMVYEKAFFADYRFFRYKVIDVYCYQVVSAFKRMFTTYRYHGSASPVGSSTRYHLWEFYWRSGRMGWTYVSVLADLFPTVLVMVSFSLLLFIEWPRFLSKFIVLNKISSRKTFRILSGVRRNYPAKISTKLLLAINNIPLHYTTGRTHYLKRSKDIFIVLTMYKRALIEIKKYPRFFIAYYKVQLVNILNEDMVRRGLSDFYREDKKRSDDYGNITLAGIIRAYIGFIREVAWLDIWWIVGYALRSPFHTTFEYMLFTMSLSSFFDVY